MSKMGVTLSLSGREIGEVKTTEGKERKASGVREYGGYLVKQRGG